MPLSCCWSGITEQHSIDRPWRGLKCWDRYLAPRSISAFRPRGDHLESELTGATLRAYLLLADPAPHSLQQTPQVPPDYNRNTSATPRSTRIANLDLDLEFSPVSSSNPSVV